jgi:DNA-binding transcriptional ArsR family regulator
MRRLVLGFPVSGSRSSGTGIFEKVKSIEALHPLRKSREEYDAICRIELRSPSGDPRDIRSSGSITEVQPLYREKDGSFVVYMRGKPLRWVMDDLGPIVGKSGVYMYGLFKLQEDKLTVSYLGNKKQVGDFLKSLLIAEINHKILSLTDARFSPDSPLYSLTEKQRRILISAFKLGYFEIPRKISFEKLSSQLDLGRSTISEHLRKAETRLISAVLNEQTETGKIT